MPRRTEIVGLFKQTFRDWTDDHAPRLGAALAYYTALSIAPLLVITLRIVSLFFGTDASRAQLEYQLRALIGPDGAQIVRDMLTSADQPVAGTVATVLGVATLVLGASGVFAQLQDSLNTIWEVQPKKGRGLWGAIRDRFLSVAMVLAVAFLLLVSMAISAMLAALGTTLDRLPDSWHLAAQAFELGVSFAVVTLLFALMFKYVPDVRMAWRDVWLGAAVTAILFLVGKLAIGLYLGHTTLASSYGVAGSFVVLLVWVYYSAQIFFFGAELTQVYANRYGSRIVPAENAEAIAGEAAARAPRPSAPPRARPA